MRRVARPRRAGFGGTSSPLSVAVRLRYSPNERVRRLPSFIHPPVNPLSQSRALLDTMAYFTARAPEDPWKKGSSAGGDAAAGPPWAPSPRAAPWREWPRALERSAGGAEAKAPPGREKPSPSLPQSSGGGTPLRSKFSRALWPLRLRSRPRERARQVPTSPGGPSARTSPRSPGAGLR